MATRRAASNFAATPSPSSTPTRREARESDARECRPGSEPELAQCVDELLEQLGTIASHADRISQAPASSKDAPVITLCANYIRRSSRDMTRTISDLREAAHIEAGSLALNRSSVDMVAAIRSAIDRLPELEGRCRLQVDEDVDAVVSVDDERMALALINVLSTTAKVSNPIAAIEIYLCRFDGHLAVVVESQARNIPTDSVTRILDWLEHPIDANDSGVSRMTLPLFVAQGIIEAHGGNVWSVSLPDLLTRIHFTLPAGSDAQPVHPTRNVDTQAS